MSIGEIRQRLEDMAGSANEAELRWRLGEWLVDLAERQNDPERRDDTEARA